jgi:hypothetical protein
MSFDQSVITDATVAVDGDALRVSWTTTAPAGTTYQVYLDGALAWSGTATAAVLPWPGDDVRVDVGAVGAGEGSTDFSADLDPSLPAWGTVQLSWPGGQYLAGDAPLVGYRVYQSPAAGAAVDFSAEVGDVAAAPQSLPGGGFGAGGFGSGGFGVAESTFAWSSRRLGGGTWTFAVVTYDSAGNSGPATTTTVTIAAPPKPPGADGSGRRLAYDGLRFVGGFGGGGFGSGGFGAGPGVAYATLHWLASPS